MSSAAARLAMAADVMIPLCLFAKICLQHCRHVILSASFSHCPFIFGPRNLAHLARERRRCSMQLVLLLIWFACVVQAAKTRRYRLQAVEGQDFMQPLHELHVDGLFPDHLTLLSQPAKLLTFDFQSALPCAPACVQVRPGRSLMTKIALTHAADHASAEEPVNLICL